MPGVIRTAMTREPMSDEAMAAGLQQITPFPRFGTAGDVGGTAAFLASDEASFINGVAIAVDGGWLAC